MKNHLEQNQEELYGGSISPHALYVRGLIIGINFQKQVKINAGKIERFFDVVMTPFSSAKMIRINFQ